MSCTLSLKMRVLIALCFVATVAQAIDVDWATVDTMQVVPEALAGILDEAVKNQPPVDSRIVGGEEATPGQFPYQVALFANTPRGTGFCGGSILHEQWVLTAAHCVDTATSVELVIGAHNVAQGDSEQFRVDVARIVIHRLWSSITIKNDIALLQLAEKLEFNDRVQPIRLPSRSQRANFVGQTGIVSGWGLDHDSATAISPVLRWTQNPIIANSRCTVYYVGWIIHSQICLSATEGRSSCSGDSGGPLVVVDSDGELTQVGLVSHGIAFGCASGWPGVYTRITAFLDWIEANSGGDVVIRN